MTDIDLTRRNLRHRLIRARNSRVIVGGEAYNEWPTTIFLHPYTLEELQLDSDPDEAMTMDFDTFLGIPLIADPRLDVGVFELRWATALVPTPTTAEV